MQVSIEDVAALLGHRDIEIFALQKQITALQKRIEELTPEEKTELQALAQREKLNT